MILNVVMALGRVPSILDGAHRFHHEKSRSSKKSSGANASHEHRACFWARTGLNAEDFERERIRILSLPAPA